MQDIGIAGVEVGLLLSSRGHKEGMEHEKQAVLLSGEAILAI
jgi:hypothetical protein